MRSLIFAAITLCATNTASAGIAYIEFATGISKISANQGFWTAPLTTSGDLGVAVNGGLYYSFGTGAKPIELHLGLAERLSATSFDGTHYGLFAIYPALRIQFSRLVIGAGYSPFVFTRTQPAGGLSELSQLSSGSSYFLEGNILFPITPQFSMGGGAEWKNASVGGATTTLLDVTVLLRFYMGFVTGEKRDSGEFKGWRYPFGRELRN